MGVHPVHEAITSDYVKRLLRIKARRLRRRREFRGAELPDIQQDLAAQVLQQARLFDPGRGAVVTFIAAVVESAAAMLCRDRSRLKRTADRPVQSLEDSVLDADGREVLYRELLRESDSGRRQGVPAVAESSRHSAAVELADALEGMATPFPEICRHLMDGKTEPWIAREMNLSRRQVRKAVVAIGERLEQAGFSET